MRLKFSHRPRESWLLIHRIVLRRSYFLWRSFMPSVSFPDVSYFSRSFASS